MIKIAHESPIELFHHVQANTDYDYALVHLFEEDEAYYKHFTQALADGREVILDNSIFELGEAFDMQQFSDWTNKLKPTWYIIPDALEDKTKTVYNAMQWMEFYKSKTKGKSIGVVQGKTYYEIMKCYEALDRLGVDMIAISFDYSLYEELVPHPNKLVSWMMGRVALLGMLVKDKVINKNKPHHLLGCALPQEGQFYRGYDWIYSMDTSNPVVHAIKGISYPPEGLMTKESQKLFELINTPADDVNTSLLDYNITAFNAWWNG
jgi:hypothetical protein